MWCEIQCTICKKYFMLEKADIFKYLDYKAGMLGPSERISLFENASENDKLLMYRGCCEKCLKDILKK